MTDTQKYILIGEDEKSYARIYQIKLGQEGYDVLVVSDGEQVVRSARKRIPDLILLDLIMPIKDGFTTLKELKADDKLCHINVIVFSNLGQQEDIEKVTALGAVDYLIKTNTSIQAMVEKVKLYLQP